MNDPQYENRYRKATGTVVATFRERNGWSLREFASHVGDVSHTSLYAIERGESTPSIDVLGRIAATFGMDLSAMLLLIIDGLDPEPAGLSDLLSHFRRLTVDQRDEVAMFMQFIGYRDEASGE